MPLGTAVEFTATAQGGSGEYEYQFWHRSQGEWHLSRSLSTNPTWQWDTSGMPSGTYHVQVGVRSKGSPPPWEAGAARTILITDLPPATEVTFTVSEGSSSRVGAAIAVSAAAAGGSGQYEYRMLVRSRELDWWVAKEYSPEATWQWDTVNLTPATYYIQVDARSAGSPAEREAVSGKQISLRENSRQLWDRLVTPYLADQLWSARDSYDAGHYLMVPLEAAFSTNDTAGQTAFADHFQRYVEASDRVIEGQLNRLQYYYLASRFVSLAQATNNADLIPAELVQILYDEVERLWRFEPAWQWDTSPFEGGIQERLNWKLSTHDVQYSYLRAITDHDLFLFGIAAELSAYEHDSGTQTTQSYAIDEVLDGAYRVYTQEVVHDSEGSGWLLQPGVWTDHPAWQYAGHAQIAPNLEPRPVPGIPMDSSHAFRLPVWLTSLANAYPSGASIRDYYDGLKQGLEAQFFEKVLVPPSAAFNGYQTNNYMDGTNTVYRYNYTSLGENNGIGPYQLSTSLFVGWWAFLGSDRIANTYGEMAGRFPLAADVVDAYVAANTLRMRHPTTTEPQTFVNGYFELISLLAAKLKA